MFRSQLISGGALTFGNALFRKYSRIFQGQIESSKFELQTHLPSMTLKVESKNLFDHVI